jgi:hypothetical protein
MRLLKTVAVAICAVHCASAASAQKIVPDAGTFRVTIQGSAAGTEQFSVTSNGAGGVTATARVSLRLPDGELELSPRLWLQGTESAPVQYQLYVGGAVPSRVISTIGRGSVQSKIVTASGEQLREFVASPGAVVLDEGIAHHYQFLAARTQQGRLPVIVPRDSRQVIATVTRIGEERVAIAGRSLALTHLLVQPQGATERHLWIDQLGRVMRLEIPASGYVAQRTEVPD